MAIDKILINGKIYTENPDMPWAEAMAVDGKKLAFVGDNDGAKALAGADTEVIDLAGKTVIVNGCSSASPRNLTLIQSDAAGVLKIPRSHSFL